MFANLVYFSCLAAYVASHTSMKLAEFWTWNWTGWDLAPAPPPRDTKTFSVAPFKNKYAEKILNFYQFFSNMSKTGLM